MTDAYSNASKSVVVVSLPAWEPKTVPAKDHPPSPLACWLLLLAPVDDAGLGRRCRPTMTTRPAAAARRRRRRAAASATLGLAQGLLQDVRMYIQIDRIRT